MNFSGKNSGRARYSPVANMTPLVDVVLQLVIFFMVTAQFAVLPGLKLLLPETVSGSLVQTAERLEIDITSDNDVFFEGQPTTIERIGDLLDQTGADGREVVVLISADQEANYSSVFRVIEALRLKNFNRVVMGATLPVQPDPGLGTDAL
ncbi:MAG: biopolymer transporter ExbD [Deltaproteobacteria bacterium]|nr:biopolymer transporter ExbD [Deltaproteobacteria bacterium]